LPQELRIRGITDIDEANRFLKRTYIREFNRKFTVQAAEPDASAFVPCTRTDLDRIFSIQTERVVNRDNTIKYRNMTLQIDRQTWRYSMEGCRVTVYQHLDGTISVGFGPQEVGRYTAEGLQLKRPVSRTSDLKPKRPAAPLPNRQTGHLMC
jgi:hypothetical protein